MNLSFMYKNHCIDPVSITEVYGTSNSDYGTAKVADNNLQSYWSTNGNIQNSELLFNFGTQVFVDSLIVVHNMDAGTLYMQAGDTNPPNTVVYGLPILGSTGTSIKYLNSPVNYKYWQLYIGGAGLSSPVKINEIFIGKRDTFSNNPQYPFKSGRESSTILTESEKGQRKVYHKYSRNNWEFFFPSINEALTGTLNNIRDFCHGSYKPFFMCIDIDDNSYETFFVRIKKGSWKHIENTYGIYDVSFGIEEEV